MSDLSKSKVLIVDDTEVNVDILVDTLGNDYDVSVAREKIFRFQVELLQ